MSPSSSHRNAKLVQWLLLLPPCLPGLVMLVLGYARDPLRTGHVVMSPMQAQDVRAHRQAGELHAAGNAALAGGLLMAVFIAWKILRPTPLEEDEKAER